MSGQGGNLVIYLDDDQDGGQQKDGQDENLDSAICEDSSAIQGSTECSSLDTGIDIKQEETTPASIQGSADYSSLDTGIDIQQEETMPDVNVGSADFSSPLDGGIDIRNPADTMYGIPPLDADEENIPLQVLSKRPIPTSVRQLTEPSISTFEVHSKQPIPAPRSTIRTSVGQLTEPSSSTFEVHSKQPVPAPRSTIRTSVRQLTESSSSTFEESRKDDKPIPKRRSLPGTTSSIKDRISFHEESVKPTVSRTERRSEPGRTSSIKDRISFHEASVKPTDSAPAGPNRGSTQKPNFKAKREMAERFTTSLNQTQHKDEVDEQNAGKDVSARPPKRLIQNPSFRASMELAERIATSSNQTQPKAEVDDRNVEKDGVTDLPTKSLTQNPSFRASRELAERVATRLFIRQPKAEVDERKEQKFDVPRVIPESTEKTMTRDTEMTRKDGTMIVAAMDFGTTYSAVAFSFKYSPDDIKAKGQRDIKEPTVILLTPEQTVHSFGNKAKKDFSEKFDEKDSYKNWYYFDCFKMKLYVPDEYLDKDIKLTDYSGKEMKAIDVFAKAIGFLREELIGLLNENRGGIVVDPNKDVHWVLTVPAIWPDLSKTFMREAAAKANIPSDYLTLALEPESASLYCRRLLGVDLRGKKYIVMDLGGGTADFACHEVMNDDSIKESHMATGGAFGGKMVDDDFLNLLTTLFGGDVIANFRRTKEYFDFIQLFEVKKRRFNGNKDFSIPLPPKIHELYEKVTGQPIAETLQQSPRSGEIYFKGDKMVLKKEIVRSMCDKPLREIINITKGILEKMDTIHHIIMVGGFSESTYIVEGVKRAFPEEGFVLTSDEPSVAVVMGAVRFGHESKAIVSRISKYTYGIGRMMIFKPGDREDYKSFQNGAFWCDNRFNKHIEIGEEISTDCDTNIKVHDYYPPDPNVTRFFIEVVASRKKDPYYTTEDGCYSVGGLMIEMDPQGDVWSKIEVKLVFKGTELEIQAFDVKNRKLTSGKVDFWG